MFSFLRRRRTTVRSRRQQNNKTTPQNNKNFLGNLIIMSLFSHLKQVNDAITKNSVFYCFFVIEFFSSAKKYFS
jgi:hypothetical protein